MNDEYATMFNIQICNNVHTLLLNHFSFDSEEVFPESINSYFEQFLYQFHNVQKYLKLFYIKFPSFDCIKVIFSKLKGLSVNCQMNNYEEKKVSNLFIIMHHN